MRRELLVAAELLLFLSLSLCDCVFVCFFIDRCVFALCFRCVRFCFRFVLRATKEIKQRGEVFSSN